MTTSAKLGIPFVSQQQSTPEVTHNEAILMMSSTLAGVESIGENTPPGSPSEGDIYVIGTSPTGAWAGRANSVAIYWVNGWRFLPDVDSDGAVITMGADQEGLKVYDKSSKSYSAWDGTAWVSLASVPAEPMYFGQRAISGNSTSIAMTAAVDLTLSTNSDYVQVTGIYNSIPDGENFGITQGTNSFTVTRSGFYRIEFWSSASSDTANTQIAYKFAIDGVISLGRRPKIYMRNIGEVHTGGAFGYHYFNAGEVVTLWIASTKTANVTIEDMVFGAHALTNGPTDGGTVGAEYINELVDVEIDSSLADGQLLAYDAIGGVWVNIDPSGMTINSIGDIDDVEIDSTLTSGQVLKWNGTAWVNANDDTGGASDVSDIETLLWQGI